MTDHTMTDRLAEELYKLGLSNGALAKKLGCCRETVAYWLTGETIPHAYYLAKFYRLGCDVIYILTGERTR